MPSGPRPTVVSQTVDTIRDAIKRGRLEPGQRLVEANLTRDFGVSRAALREALGRLSAEGLIDLEPYRGAVVRRLTHDDVIELFEVREAIETHAAALAAERIDADDNRARMVAAIEAMRSYASGDAQGYLDENERFHEAIMAIAANRLLADIAVQLQTHAFRLQFRQLLNPEATAVSIADHVAIAEAILAGDVDGSRTAMRCHIRRARQLTVTLPTEAFG